MNSSPRQLTEAIATNPIAALPTITALQKQTDEHLREAVRYPRLAETTDPFVDSGVLRAWSDTSGVA